MEVLEVVPSVGPIPRVSQLSVGGVQEIFCIQNLSFVVVREVAVVAILWLVFFGVVQEICIGRLFVLFVREVESEPATHIFVTWTSTFSRTVR